MNWTSSQTQPEWKKSFSWDETLDSEQEKGLQKEWKASIMEAMFRSIEDFSLLSKFEP